MAHKNRIPSELRKLDRWVAYAAVTRKGRKTKMPVAPDGAAASSTDPDTWSPYSRVRNLPRKGFVLDGDGIVCLDLDHCLTEGRLTDQATALLARLPDTYVEVSPSGDGLHVWGYASVDKGRVLPGVEVYGTGRYITITGRRFSGKSLEDISDVVADLL